MRMVDIITKKRNGEPLTDEEIAFFVSGYTRGEIPDYQASALLMAICLQGMDDRETASLTACMAASGDQVDLSAIDGIKVDKHSTGGVGDKTTLIVAPVAAACGVRVAKMSGRGLGHTGGTVDKLEAIPGFRTALPPEEFFRVVNQTGLCVIGQSGNLAPADKKLYALRDVTGTVESLPLIASSIMSKKLAAGADCILLDVKTGSGAFMKTLEGSLDLAKAMVKIGERAGKPTLALITDMDTPLGRAVGNSLEVAEAVKTLRGEGPEDLTRVCLELAAAMLFLAGLGDEKACKTLARKALESGAAFSRLREMVQAQGGDVSVIDDPEKFPKAGAEREVPAPKSGYLAAMDTRKIGGASVLLGAGRAVKESAVDPAAGILLRVKTGDFVEQGQPLARFFAAKEALFPDAEALFLSGIGFSEEKPKALPLIYARVNRNGAKLL